MARGKGAIPGVGPAAKGRKRQVKVKAHVRRVPGVGAASRAKAPVPSRSKAPSTGRVPGVGPAAQKPARAPSQGSKRYRRARQGTGGLPGVSTAVNPHLAEHRVHRGRQEEVAAEASQRAGNLTSGPVDMARPLAARPPAVASDTLARVIKGMGTVGKGAGLGKQTGPSFSIDTSKPGDVVNKALTTLSPVDLVTGHTPKDELTGKGALADATKTVKDVVTGALKIPALRQLNPPSLIGEGLGAVRKGVGLPKDTKIGGLKIGAPEEVVTNVLKDALDLPAQAVPSVAVPVMGAVEAAQGRPKRLDDFVKSVKQGDPVYKTLAGTVHALSGDSGQASKDFAVAAKGFHDHPLATALEVSGVKGAVGRGAGGAMRSGVLGSRAAELASTKREPLQLFGRAEEKRSFSPDVTTKIAQVRRDKRVLREQAAELKGGAEQLRKTIPTLPEHMRPAAQEQLAANEARLAKGGHQATDTKLEDALRRRADEEVDAAEQVRRMNRSDVIKRESKAIPQGTAGDLVPFINEGTVRTPRTLVEDLQARRAVLDMEQHGLRGGERADNRRMAEQIDRVLADKKLLANPKPTFAAADDLTARQRIVEAEREKLGDVLPAQTRKARLVPYAVTHMDAYPGRDGVLRSEQGATIGAPEIESHMRANGVDPEKVGFFSQRPGTTGPGAYFQSQTRRPSVASRTRTGMSSRTGAYAADRETLIAHQVRSHGRLDAMRTVNRMVDLVGAKKPGPGDGYFNNRSEAMAAVRKISETNEHAPDLVPFDMAQAFTPAEHLQQIREGVDPHTLDAEMADRFAVNAAGAANAGEGGRIVLMPREFVDQLAKHEKTLGGTNFEKGAQAFTQAFRHTVLNLSTKWIFGNLAEMYAIRLPVAAGITAPVKLPAAYVLGRKMLKRTEQLDPQEAKQVRARVLGGGHLSTSKRLDVHRSAEQFTGRWRKLVAAMGAAARSPGPKQLGSVWTHYRNLIQNVNSTLERQGSIAAMGLEGMKEWGEIKGSWMQALVHGRSAVEDLAKGLLDSENQVRYGRSVKEVIGQYGDLSPGMRRLVTGYAPFILWYRNALKFVYLTMPTKHPVATGAIAAAFQATEAERKKHGLGEFFTDRVPGFLQGSIPVGGGGRITASRYTPFGAFGDIPEGLSTAILPEISGMADTFRGINWQGNKLRMADGSEPNELERMWLGLYATAESTVAPLAVVRTLREKGGSAYDDSTVFSPKVKPGTGGSILDALNKRFNPLRPVPPTSKQAGGSKKVDPATQIARELGLEQAPSRKRKKTSQADQLAKDLGIQP